MEKKKIIFIMNPISGTASKAGIPKLIERYLDTNKFDYEIKLTEYAGHAAELAAEAKDNHIDIVVAVGGDGTVNEVARAIVQSSTALGSSHVVQEMALHVTCYYLSIWLNPSRLSTLQKFINSIMASSTNIHFSAPAVWDLMPLSVISLQKQVSVAQ